MNDHIYDIETYPNVFTLAIKEVTTGQIYVFEISQRRNDVFQLLEYILFLQRSNARMIGFNNIGFDYPVLHYIMQYSNLLSNEGIYNKALSIITANKDEKFGHLVWERDHYVNQIDLFKIHHFDNVAKFTSLKMLEFNMQSDNIIDLPFPPGTYLEPHQIDTLIKYNIHDVNETEKFFNKSLKLIEFREYLSQKYNKNFINFNDGKIGKEIIVMEIEKVTPGACFTKVNNRRVPNQTPRPLILFKDVIFPYIKFNNPEFNKVLDWFKNKAIEGYNTKASIKDLSCCINGFNFNFGTGGIHGSVESCTVMSDPENVILDLDVTSYYPSIGIVNKKYPEHLGPIFCEIYDSLKQERISYEKGTPENTMLKYALNVPYGQSNSIYSPFYDPKYTMIITINGQLLLCMLADYLIPIPSVQMVQINTDGLTIKCRRDVLPQVEQVCNWWQQYTCLDLEHAFYRRMFIRDVNNYIAEYENGKIKRKGAYEHKLEWNKNYSSLVVQKAVEQYLLKGTAVEHFIYNHTDINDFMLRTKVNRNCRLILNEQPLQNISRYYIAKRGGALVKIMPPLRGNIEERRIGINVGWLAAECNNIATFDPGNVNYEFYISEAKKLITPLLGGF